MQHIRIPMWDTGHSSIDQPKTVCVEVD